MKLTILSSKYNFGIITGSLCLIRSKIKENRKKTAATKAVFCILKFIHGKNLISR